MYGNGISRAMTGALIAAAILGALALLLLGGIGWGVWWLIQHLGWVA